MRFLIISCVLTAVTITAACSDNEAPKAPASKQGVAVMENYASSIQLSDLVGDWKAGDGVGKIAGSEPSNLTVITEKGYSGVGVINKDKIEVAIFNVTGRLTADKKKIVWSNGFEWYR